MRFFYDGLDPISRANLDVGAGAELSKIPQGQLKSTIREVIKNYSWGGRRRTAKPKKSWKFELDPTDQIQSKMDELSKNLSKINLASSNPSQVNSFSCDICGRTDHNTFDCRGTYSEHVVVIKNQGYRSNQEGGWK